MSSEISNSRIEIRAELHKKCDEKDLEILSLKSDIKYLRNTQKLFLTYQLFESLITLHNIIRYSNKFNFLDTRFYKNLSNGLRFAQLVAFSRFMLIVQSDHKIDAHLKTVVFSKFFNRFYNLFFNLWISGF
jgi:hypothetical protein